MAITLRSRREIELMRKAGAVVADVLLKLKEIAEPGISTAWLDQTALEMTAEVGAEALFKGVRSPVARIPFPGAICASINEQVVHGIPSEDTRKLMDTTKRVLGIAIEKSEPAVRWSQVAAEMQRCAESAGFSVVKDFVGHGIGREMHEEPRVPNFVSKELLENDMINAGSSAVRTLKNGWTVVTRDGKSSAHFENTIVITKNGCEVLTVNGN